MDTLELANRSNPQRRREVVILQRFEDLDEKYEKNTRDYK